MLKALISQRLTSVVCYDSVMFQNKKIASLLWISNIQYFIVQILAAERWAEPFSIRFNTISDLGNTVCGMYGDRFVCSPWHAGMNVSFIVLGLTQLLGALLLMKTLGTTRTAFIALSMSVLAGIGTIFVGLFPENSIAALHVVGAALPFFFGNIVLLLFGVTRVLPRWLRIYSLTSGILAFIALGMFLTGFDAGLGFGATERITAYAQTIWMIVIGTYLLQTGHKQSTIIR